jgi:hypothetical protein
MVVTVDPVPVIAKFGKAGVAANRGCNRGGTVNLSHRVG